MTKDWADPAEVAKLASLWLELARDERDVRVRELARMAFVRALELGHDVEAAERITRELGEQVIDEAGRQFEAKLAAHDLH